MSDPHLPFRDSQAVSALRDRVLKAAERLSRPVTLMEVCGTHTHAIASAGLRRLMPPQVRLVSGPGCPVCVTPVPYVDRAEALARQPGVTVCSFGDLLRVPSTTGSLEKARADGADVRIVYSPNDAVDLASSDPSRRVVFLGVGFETTAPTIAAALARAEAEGVENFLVLGGHKVMPPPLRALASDPTVRVSGFLLPGHVSVITGSKAFEFLARDFGIPGAIVGFNPTDVLSGVLDLVRHLTDERPAVVNLYPRVVTPDGNLQARAVLDRFFATCDAEWRGLGVIRASGLALRPAYDHRDASLIPAELPEPVEPAGCLCGEVLKGSIDPPDCPLFGSACTPATAVGACMVSSEGTCAAWYRHERHRGEASA